MSLPRRDGQQAYPGHPIHGIVRGKAPCSHCGIRAWKWRNLPDPSGVTGSTQLVCLGCDRGQDGRRHPQRVTVIAAEQAVANDPHVEVWINVSDGNLNKGEAYTSQEEALASKPADENRATYGPFRVRAEDWWVPYTRDQVREYAEAVLGALALPANDGEVEAVMPLLLALARVKDTEERSVDRGGES